MSNLVFITGDFCSGSTLVYTLFRKSGHYHCLYEPLHEKLREYLIYGPRAERQDHHFFLENDYYQEFAGFDKAAELFNPAWGIRDFFMPEDATADELYRYLSYLIGTGFSRSPRVLLKENRMPFRMAWFRKNFPHAKVVHIYRRREEQWKSLVKRAQEFLGKEDVGQDSVNFAGFNVSTWCDDLAPRFPQLAASQSATGAERFAKLWELSYESNRASSDVSVGYHELLTDFEATWDRISKAIGLPATDVESLKQFVVTPDKKDAMLARGYGQIGSIAAVRDLVGRKYADVRVKLQDQWRGSRS